MPWLLQGIFRSGNQGTGNFYSVLNQSMGMACPKHYDAGATDRAAKSTQQRKRKNNAAD